MEQHTGKGNGTEDKLFRASATLLEHGGIYTYLYTSMVRAN